MTEKDVKIYICDFCGYMSEDKEFLRLHEECCPKNQKNQPCSICSNMIIGMGCSKNVNCDDICDNVKCFCFQEGTPINPFSAFTNIDIENNSDGGVSDDDKE